MPAQGRDRGSERRPEPSKGASRNLRTPLNRPSRGETTRFRAFRSQTARGSDRRDRRTGFTLPLSLGESAFHGPVPARYARRAGAVERPLSPRCRPTHARHPAHPATPLPLAPLPRNRHRPRARSVATPRSHLDCRNVLILIVAGHRTSDIQHARVYPRPRGGAAVLGTSRSTVSGLSPPTRGSPFRPTYLFAESGSIPAHAGEPPRPSGRRSPQWVYPRPRGGAVVPQPMQNHPAGLSPPTRGSHGWERVQEGYTGSIPAHAGEPWDSPLVLDIYKVYPRPRGGAWLLTRKRRALQGLSPPTRGSLGP